MDDQRGRDVRRARRSRPCRRRLGGIKPTTRMMPVVVILLLYAAWITMLAVHESGHVLHAWISGVRVIDVQLPWFGFSETIVGVVPRPPGVVVGGVLWGCLWPAILTALLACGDAGAGAPRRLRWLAAWMGFCWIANGAYLAAGAWLNIGDAAELRTLGYSCGGMVLVGALLSAAGLYVWHVLTRREPSAPRRDRES